MALVRTPHVAHPCPGPAESRVESALTSAFRDSAVPRIMLPRTLAKKHVRTHRWIQVDSFVSLDIDAQARCLTHTSNLQSRPFHSITRPMTYSLFFWYRNRHSRVVLGMVVGSLVQKCKECQQYDLSPSVGILALEAKVKNKFNVRLELLILFAHSYIV